VKFNGILLTEEFEGIHANIPHEAEIHRTDGEVGVNGAHSPFISD
jgi:hypothetical protein